MHLYKHIVLVFGLLFYSVFCFASVPDEITLGGIVYIKSEEDMMGNHKKSEYYQKGQTSNQWTSKVAIHYFMNETDPTQFAQTQFGASSKIEPINGDKNNILQFFDTMNSIGQPGEPTIFQQNLWRYQKMNYGKGIISVQYTTSKIIANQTAPAAIAGISQDVQNEIKALPVERYEF